MQFIFDNLSALIIAGGAFIILASLYLVQVENGTNVTESYVLETSRSGFLDQLELDLSNIGMGVPSGFRPIDSLATDLIAFYGAIDSTGTGGLITYTLKTAGVREGVQTFRLERRADSTVTGGSGGYITDFQVRLHDADGTSLPDSLRAAAVSVGVDIEWMAPFDRVQAHQKSSRLSRSAWSTTIYPLGLQ